MFHCDQRFHQHAKQIRYVWEWRFNKTIGNWRSLWWWWAVVIVWGFLLILPLMAVSNFSPFSYLRGIYCPVVGDCVTFLSHWPLPIWYWIHFFLAFLALLSGLLTQWSYRRENWCLAWWAYLAYLFAYFYFLGVSMESIIFVGLTGAPIPQALVGYGLPIIYTIWFMGALLPTMRLLWRGEYVDFRPPPLKLQAGAGGAAALLGVLGVALGRMFGEMPNGRWGYFIIGIILVPWLMYLGIRGVVQSLLTLAPWRIVLETEAKAREGKGNDEAKP